MTRGVAGPRGRVEQVQGPERPLPPTDWGGGGEGRPQPRALVLTSGSNPSLVDTVTAFLVPTARVSTNILLPFFWFSSFLRPRGKAVCFFRLGCAVCPFVCFYFAFNDDVFLLGVSDTPKIHPSENSQVEMH